MNLKRHAGLISSLGETLTAAVIYDFYGERWRSKQDFRMVIGLSKNSNMAAGWLSHPSPPGTPKVEPNLK